VTTAGRDAAGVRRGLRILEARSSGKGQVLDAAMVDGAALLTTLMHGMHAAGVWSETPGPTCWTPGTLLRGLRDGRRRHVAVGAIEPQFYLKLLELLQIEPAEMPQFEQPRWPEFKERLATVSPTAPPLNGRGCLSTKRSV